MSLDDDIRRVRPASGHRHLPLTPRAEQELADLFSESAAPVATPSQASPDQPLPFEGTPEGAMPMLSWPDEDAQQTPRAPAHRALVALVACVAIALAIPLGILLWPGPDEPVPPAEPGPTAPEPASEPAPTDEPEPESAGELTDSEDPADPDPRLTDLPDGGTDRAGDTALPGQDRASHFAQADRVADIVMVDYDDVLHVRGAPGPEGEIVGELPADGHVVLAGRARALGLEEDETWSPDESVWAEVRLSDGYGWVHTHYLGYLGSAEADPAVADDVPPVTDPAQIAVSLGTRIASSWERPDDGASAPGLGEPAWSVVHAEEDGHRATYWVDVTGLADDSGRGTRYQLDLVDTGHGWEIEEVVAIAICRRGVSEDSGYCV